MTATEAALAHAERSPETTRERLITWQDPVPVAAAGAAMSGLEYVAAISAGELPPPPIAVLMRMQPVELEPGRVVFEGEPGEEHYNPIGTVHGGYAATLLDSVLGCAVHTTLPAGIGYTTLTLEVKMVRPIKRRAVDEGLAPREAGEDADGVRDSLPRVRAEADVLHRGRKQATATANLLDAESGKLLAHGTSTCLILGDG